MDVVIPLKVEVRREVVYREVWAEPIDAVAARYGVTTELLRKACRRMGVPVPRQTHWTKVASGKRPRRPALSPLEAGMERAVVLLRKHARRKRLTAATRPLGEPLDIPPIPVPQEPEPVHPLVRRIAEDHATAIKDEHGRLKSRRQGTVALPVSPEMKERALGILDALVRALDERGYGVSAGETLVAATPFGPVPFGIREEIDKVEREPTAEERRRHEGRIYHPLDDFPRIPPKYHKEVLSGRLALVLLVDDRHEQRGKWADSGRRKLESLLPSFVSGMLRYAEVHKGVLDERETRQRLREEESRRRLEESVRRQEEQDRRERLWKEIERWQKAQTVRDYAAALTSAWRERHGREPEGEFAERISWMLGYADRIDPTRNLKEG